MNWRFNLPTTRLLTLTPALARELLALNDPRRTSASDSSLVDIYAQQMMLGQWIFNGDTYKINTQGHLIDGQHRLQAAIKTDWSGLVLICMGISIGAAWVMDPPGKVIGPFRLEDVNLAARRSTNVREPGTDYDYASTGSGVKH